MQQGVVAHYQVERAISEVTEIAVKVFVKGLEVVFGETSLERLLLVVLVLALTQVYADQALETSDLPQFAGDHS